MVRIAADKKARDDAKNGIVPEGPTLLSAADLAVLEPQPTEDEAY